MSGPGPHLTGLLLGLWIHGAHAQGEPKVVILNARAATDRAAVERLAAARAALDEERPGSGVSVTAALDAGDPEAADSALAEGEQALADLDLSAAAAAFDRALEAALALDDEPRRRAARKALLGQARAALAGRRGARAREALEALLNLEPDFAFEAPPRPSLAAVFAEAKRRVGGPERAALRVETTPVSATLYVDGRLVGVTPALIPQATLGAHVLAVRADGYRLTVKSARLVPGPGIAVRVELARARKGALLETIRRALDEEPPLGAMRDLRSLFLADQAIVLRGDASGASGVLYDLRGRREVASARTGPGDPHAQGRALVFGLLAGARAGEEAVLDLEDPAEVGPPIFDRWWFWPAVGVGIAAAIVLPILAVDDPAAGEPPKDAGSVLLRF